MLKFILAVNDNKLYNIKKDIKSIKQSNISVEIEELQSTSKANYTVIELTCKFLDKFISSRVQLKGTLIERLNKVFHRTLRFHSDGEVNIPGQEPNGMLIVEDFSKVRVVPFQTYIIVKENSVPYFDIAVFGAFMTKPCKAHYEDSILLRKSIKKLYEACQKSPVLDASDILDEEDFVYNTQYAVNVIRTFDSIAGLTFNPEVDKIFLTLMAIVDKFVIFNETYVELEEMLTQLDDEGFKV